MGLVITRKRRERVSIGDSIIITIIESTSRRVKLKIEAPKNQEIIRLPVEVVVRRDGEFRK